MFSKMVLFNLQSACDRFIQSRAPSSRALLRFRSGRSLERLFIITHRFRKVNTFFHIFSTFFRLFSNTYFLRHFAHLTAFQAAPQGNLHIETAPDDRIPAIRSGFLMMISRFSVILFRFLFQFFKKSFLLCSSIFHQGNR